MGGRERSGERNCKGLVIVRDLWAAPEPWWAGLGGATDGELWSELARDCMGTGGRG